MRVGPAQLWPDVAPQWILNLPKGLEEFCYDIYKSFIYDIVFFKGHIIQAIGGFLCSEIRLSSSPATATQPPSAATTSSMLPYTGAIRHSSAVLE